MSLEICDLLLHVDSILHDLPLRLLGLNPNLEHLIDDLLNIFNHIVMLRVKVFISLIDDLDKDFTVILEGTSKCL